MTMPKRGEVYLVNFDPTIGSEIQKTRPALIIQNDIANQHSPITIVAAITSKVEETLFPTEVNVPPKEGGLERASIILLNQIRSIDQRRLIKRLGVIKVETMVRVNRALEISFGLVDI
jgi:mRNA interferase MazF